MLGVARSLTYGREEAAELIKKKKEAKKKGERFLDMTLKASLKSVKAASTMLTDATLLASKMTLDVTKESMNVMEKAAERTMERSKEMARLVRWLPARPHAPCPTARGVTFHSGVI